MSRALTILGTTLGVSLGVLALLLAALSIYFSRWDGILFYTIVSLLAFALATWLFRRERRGRRAREALLPTELRPARRVPRQPIRLPLRATLLAFALWYAAAVAVMYLVGGGLYFFDLALIAPFAAFMLTVLTFAGRHIAFRLTAEEADAAARPPGIEEEPR